MDEQPDRPPQDGEPQASHEPSPPSSPPRLMRSRSNRVIAGVAGGIAEHFGIDPVIVRLAWVALILFGGGGVLLYIIAWIIMPEAESDAPQAATGSGETARLVIGAVLIVLGLVWLAGPISIAVVRFGIPVALVLAGAYIIAAKR